eukprot:764473-Hanusia_phi.AAC.1
MTHCQPSLTLSGLDNALTPAGAINVTWDDSERMVGNWNSPRLTTDMPSSDTTVTLSWKFAFDLENPALAQHGRMVSISVKLTSLNDSSTQSWSKPSIPTLTHNSTGSLIIPSDFETSVIIPMQAYDLKLNVTLVNNSESLTWTSLFANIEVQFLDRLQEQLGHERIQGNYTAQVLTGGTVQIHLHTAEVSLALIKEVITNAMQSITANFHLATIDVVVEHNSSYVLHERNLIDSDPLYIRNNSVTVSNIWQKTFHPCADNTIYVDFETRFPIYTSPHCNPKITIEGLVGSITPSTASLEITRSADEINLGPGEWQQTLGKLVVPIMEGTQSNTIGNKVYSMQFGLRNQAHNQTSPAVEFRIDHYVPGIVQMNRIGGKTSDFEATVGSTQPLEIVAMAYKLKTAGQTSPYPGCQNTITVTLQYNIPFYPSNCQNYIKIVVPKPKNDSSAPTFALPSVSFVTGMNSLSLIGKTHIYRTANDSWFAPGQCDSQSKLAAASFMDAYNTGTAGYGHLTNETCTTNSDSLGIQMWVGETISANTPIVLQFQAINPMRQNDPHPLKIETNVISSLPNDKQVLGSGGCTDAIDSDKTSLLCCTSCSPERHAVAADATRTTDVDGYGQNTIYGDAEPFKVHAPFFCTRYIGQSTQFPCAINTISITITANSPMLANRTVITLTGFNGAHAPTGDIDLGGGDNMLGQHMQFSSSLGGSVGKGHWNNELKQLYLYVTTTVDCGTDVQLKFNVTNDAKAQSYQMISITASFSNEHRTTPLGFTHDQAPGKQAMLIYETKFTAIAVTSSSSEPCDNNVIKIEGLEANTPIFQTETCKPTIHICNLNNPVISAAKIPFSYTFTDDIMMNDTLTWDGCSCLIWNVTERLPFDIKRANVEFEVRNPAMKQTPQVINLRAQHFGYNPSDIGGMYSTMNLLGSPVMAVQYESLQFEVNQTSYYPCDQNTITILVKVPVKMVSGCEWTVQIGNMPAYFGHSVFNVDGLGDLSLDHSVSYWNTSASMSNITIHINSEVPRSSEFKIQVYLRNSGSPSDVCNLITQWSLSTHPWFMTNTCFNKSAHSYSNSLVLKPDTGVCRVERGVITHAYISQNNTVPCDENYLYVEISTSIPLFAACDNKFTMTGFGPNFAYNDEATAYSEDFVNVNVSLNLASGTLVLSPGIDAGHRWNAGQIYIIMIKLRNKAVGSVPDIHLVKDGLPMLSSVKMNVSNTTSEKPFYLDVPVLNISSISQSSRSPCFQGATLTINFLLNVGISSYCHPSITLGGLDARFNPRLDTNGNSDWGNTFVSILPRTANTHYVVKVLVDNPVDVFTKSVTLNGTYGVTASVVNHIAEVSKPGYSGTGVQLDVAVSSSSSTPCAQNTITVTVTPKTSLTCASEALLFYFGPCMHIDADNSKVLLTSTSVETGAVLNKTALQVFLKPNGLPADQAVEFSFNSFNDLNCTEPNFLPHVEALQAKGSQFFNYTLDFRSKFIVNTSLEQSSEVPCDSNTIRISFKVSQDIPKSCLTNEAVTIRGLKFSQTPTLLSSDLSGSSVASETGILMADTLEWNPADGSMVLSLSKDIPKNQENDLIFILTNPAIESFPGDHVDFSFTYKDSVTVTEHVSSVALKTVRATASVKLLPPKWDVPCSTAEYIINFNFTQKIVRGCPYRLFVSNLGSHNTSSTDSLPIDTCPGNILITAPTGKYIVPYFSNGTDAELAVNITEGAEANQTYCFRVLLQNDCPPQQPAGLECYNQSTYLFKTFYVFNFGNLNSTEVQAVKTYLIDRLTSPFEINRTIAEFNGNVLVLNAVDLSLALQILTAATSNSGGSSLSIPNGLSFTPSAVCFFTFLLASQDNPYPCHRNRISITFKTSADLPKGTRLTISGLEHIVTGPDATSVDLFVSDSEVLPTTGKFSNSTGGLIFELSKDSIKDLDYAISFDVLNPTAEGIGNSARLLRSAATLQIEADKLCVGKSTIPNDYKTCLYQRYGIQGARPGDAAPLVVLRGFFSYKKIGQSSPYQGAENTITVTLASTVPLQPSCNGQDVQIKIYNLLSQPNGIDSRDVALFPMRGKCNGRDSDPLSFKSVDGKVGYGYWNKTGAASLTLVPAVATVPSHEYVFSFRMKNPSVPHSNNAVSISCESMNISAVPMDFDTGEISCCSTLSTSSLCLPKVASDLVAYSRPFNLVENKFCLLEMQRSSVFPCGRNCIDLTFVMSFSVSEGDSVFTISGLLGLTWPSANVTLQDGSGGLNHQHLFKDIGNVVGQANWYSSPSSKTLKMYVASPLNSEIEYKLRFCLYNIDQYQEPSYAYLEVSHSGVSQIPQTAAASMINDVRAANVQTFVFAGSSSVPCDNNEISMKLQLNVPLYERCPLKITVTGLNGISRPYDPIEGIVSSDNVMFGTMSSYTVILDTSSAGNSIAYTSSSIKMNLTALYSADNFSTGTAQTEWWYMIKFNTSNPSCTREIYSSEVHVSLFYGSTDAYVNPASNVGLLAAFQVDGIEFTADAVYSSSDRCQANDISLTITPSLDLYPFCQGRVRTLMISHLPAQSLYSTNVSVIMDYLTITSIKWESSEYLNISLDKLSL